MTEPEKPKPESREMFTEISSLVASLAKALGLPEAETAAAVERGEIRLSLDRDANGNAFIAARHGEKSVRVYQGAIKRGT
jgi:hypothetical protein